MQIPRPTRYQRKQTPTVIQMEAAECGPAALAIIMGYHGCFVPLEQVRTLCSVSRDGSNAYKILIAAEHYGLKSEGFSAKLEELYEAELPLIAFWNFNHFVVIEGFRKEGVFINDPETGPRCVSYDAFNESFTGVILTFTPTERFRKIPFQNERMWISTLWSRLRSFKSSLIYAFFIGCLSIIPPLVLTSASQQFIDEVVVGGKIASSAPLLIAFALAILFMGGVSWMQSKQLNRLTIAVTSSMSEQFVRRLLRLPISFFLQRYGAEVASRMPLNDEIAKAAIEEILPALLNILLASFFATAMLIYDIPIALIAITIVLINVCLMRFLYRSREDAYAQYKQIQGKLTSFAMNGLEGVESIKGAGGEGQWISRYGALYSKSLTALQQMAQSDLFLGSVSSFLAAVGSLSLLILGGYRILHGEMTVGDLVALQLLFALFTTPAMQLIHLSQTIQLFRINLLRVDDVMLHPEDPMQNSKYESNREKDLPLVGEVEVRNLSFAYAPLDPPVIEDVSLLIPAGSSVALVGPSGCGKSTLVKLIGGLLTPHHGEVLFDRIPASQQPRQRLNRSVAVVEQTPYLFEESVELNITLLDTHFCEQSLIQAAQEACIHNEIMERKVGYQTRIERGGGNFSGGQRQRIEIAAALYRNPSILILDEATSAVDVATERRILENIRLRGQTTLIVTHRLESIKECSLIVVMDEGKIVEKGTHDELIEKRGLYCEMVECAEQLEVIYE